jgi:hypothetical protein
MPLSLIAVFAVMALFSYVIPSKASTAQVAVAGPSNSASVDTESLPVCGEEKPEENPKYVATDFAPWNHLSAKQRGLLGKYLLRFEGGMAYEKWVETNNGHASAFLAVTNALDRTTVHTSVGDFTALDMVTGVKRIHSDRIRVELDPVKFQEWNRTGGRFTIIKQDGKLEQGRVKFRDHTYIGSSLHCGYEIQGATSILKVPRIQFNYRYSDSEADIDIDGFSIFIWGFIPNPQHLTRANSDVRHWLDKYSKKFGDPGFTAMKMR